MIFRFGPFELDADRGELRRAGEPVAIQPKPLALLTLLIESRDRIVPLREITETLWPDTAVTPSSLTRAASHARRAIGDTHQGSLLRSYPRRGYRFCAEVVALAAAPSPPEAERGRTPRGEPDAPRVPAERGLPFVGRQEGLERLEAALEAALGGHGRVSLAHGSAGMGKTRLVEEFASLASQRGALVFRGNAREGPGVPAFWMWEQILRQLLREPAVADEARDFVGRSRELVQWLPEVAAPDTSTHSERQVEQSRFLLFEASARVLSRCARRRPLVLVLEDLQWAESASLRLLEHVAFEIGRDPILIVATLRDEPRPRAHPLSKILASMSRADHFTQVPLDGLSRGEVALLLRRVTGAPAPSDLTSELWSLTEGVPLFVREALRVLEERGELAHPERIRRQGLVLPSQVLELIGRSLEALAPESARLIGAAAVLGREVPLRMAAGVAEMDPGDALDRIDEAVRAGVLEEVDGATATYRFTHALYQESAYRGLSLGARTRLHHRAALRLEQQHAHELDRVIAELAHHHHRGMAVGSPERAFELATRAAERASQLLAYEQAALHYEQAATALDQCQTVDPERRLRTLLALGSALRLAGDRERRREVLSQAMQSARALAQPVAFAHAAIELCDVSEWSHRDELAATALHEALEGLDPSYRVERARVLTRLAYLAQRDREQAEPFARRGIALAREAEDADALQDALYVLSYVLAGPHDLREREQLADELVKLAAAAHSRAPALIALIDAACDRIALGDGEGARQRRAQAEAVAGDQPPPVMVWHLRVYDAGLALLRGDLARADELSASALLIGQRIEHPYAAGCYLAHRMGVARERGDHAEVLAQLARMNVPDAPLHWVRAITARTYLETDREEEARALWSQLARQRLEDLPPGIRWTDSMVELAHLCADLGDGALAPLLIDRLRPIEHHHGVLPVPICYGGPVSHALARLYELSGRPDDARSLYEDALTTSASLGARPAHARVLRDLGRSCAERDPKRSRALLQQCADLADELGLHVLATDARRST